MHARLLALLTLLLALVVTARAEAYTPPPMTAHVTDTAGKLTEEQRLALDKKLEDYRLRTSNEIAVFIPKSLEGETIEDVGMATGRAWKLGVKGKDNGVLLVIAPVERKARIEVGRGVEGSLPDLRANDIIRQKIRPNLAPGREDYDAAVNAATDAIIADLDAGGTGSSGARARPKPATVGDVLFGLLFLAFIIGIPILLLVAFIRGIASAFTSNGRSAGSGWASGSSWSSDSSWSSSSNDSSWSSGGGDSGFSGGGGDFGGGGSSDSF